MLKKSFIWLCSAALIGQAWGQFGVTGGAGAFTTSPGADLSGNWSPVAHEESVGDPAIAEFAGVPINEGTRAWGLAWSPSRVLATTPTTSIVGTSLSGVAPSCNRFPSGLSLWKKVRAMVALISTTAGDLSLSALVKFLPCRSGTPSVSR